MPLKRQILALWLLGVVIHAAWAWTIPEPMDWDPAYYRTVARHIVDGEGAVVGAVWNFLWLPQSLPYAADLHWMPLPSRVLVPGVWLWWAHGDQVVTIALASTWGPLAWLLARRLGASTAVALGAGLFAATGLCYARFVSTPDCIALYGLLGCVGMLELERQRPLGVGLVAVLAALCRNDGFLLGPCLALGLRGRAALVVALAGPAASAVWHLRNASIAGPAYWAARSVTANVIDTESLLGLTLGSVQPLTLMERLSFVGTEGVETALLIWLVALPLPSLALWFRREAWLRGAKAYWLFMPLVSQFLAPGVSASGSVYRSASALFPLACAVAAIVLFSIGEWSAKKRGYHRLFLPTLLGGGLFAGSALLMVQQVRNPSPLPSTVCDELKSVPPGEPVFSVHPLLLEAHCGRPAIAFVRGLSREKAEALADRYHARYALVMPENDGYSASPREKDAREVFPGWSQITPRLFAAPGAPLVQSTSRNERTR